MIFSLFGMKLQHAPARRPSIFVTAVYFTSCDFLGPVLFKTWQFPFSCSWILEHFPWPHLGKLLAQFLLIPCTLVSQKFYVCTPRSGTSWSMCEYNSSEELLQNIWRNSSNPYSTHFFRWFHHLGRKAYCFFSKAPVLSFLFLFLLWLSLLYLFQIQV